MANQNPKSNPDRPIVRRERWRFPPRPVKIRKDLGLSQTQFSSRYGIPLRTLRKWENEGSDPSGAAATLLKLILVNPDAVTELLRQADAQEQALIPHRPRLRLTERLSEDINA